MATARGSGTNGFVQRNLSHVRGSGTTKNYKNDGERDDDNRRPFRAADQGILDHNKKRQIEVECMEFRAELEAEGVITSQIDIEVEQLRQSLIAKFSSDSRNAGSKGGWGNDPKDSHSKSEAKERENDRYLCVYMFI